MKLQTKFIAVLLSATLLAFIGSQVFQQALSTEALKRLGSENVESLEQREKIHAENIFQTADPIVRDTISVGEMDKLDALIKNFTNHRRDSRVFYLRSQRRPGLFLQPRSFEIPANTANDIKDLVFSDPAKLSRQTSNAFEIYRRWWPPQNV